MKTFPRPKCSRQKRISSVTELSSVRRDGNNNSLIMRASPSSSCFLKCSLLDKWTIYHVRNAVYRMLNCLLYVVNVQCMYVFCVVFKTINCITVFVYKVSERYNKNLANIGGLYRTAARQERKNSVSSEKRHTIVIKLISAII